MQRYLLNYLLKKEISLVDAKEIWADGTQDWQERGDVSSPPCQGEHLALLLGTKPRYQMQPGISFDLACVTVIFMSLKLINPLCL